MPRKRRRTSFRWRIFRFPAEDAPGLRFVGAFSNAEDAIRSLPKHAPDVFLMEPEGEPLSERETEVLGYITKGYSGKEIADKMHVSINTVKTHLKHIYQKLHVRSRPSLKIIPRDDCFLWSGWCNLTKN